MRQPPWELHRSLHLLLTDALIMAILSAVIDTITILLNTPIVPPPDNVSARVVALKELPTRHRGQRDSSTTERTLSERSEAADVFPLGRSSIGSTRTSTQTRGSGNSTALDELSGWRSSGSHDKPQAVNGLSTRTA
ncbi:hypothetical protein PAXRUDRAFT_571459 [Paxillus rubicundulus Ve08.2h10]|uniref:Uncharacterized protein n=1 Tax=Paxillus rubicundulus Ve08.2h10 TaxID=930991 RepID=A0A0D0DZG9_9AGAM|nr:hypothetical protein PAXRUDRAFT_571459 [Paxillus rubicundulus Ve08.2h10]